MKGKQSTDTARKKNIAMEGILQAAKLIFAKDTRIAELEAGIRLIAGQCGSCRAVLQTCDRLLDLGAPRKLPASHGHAG